MSLEPPFTGCTELVCVVMLQVMLPLFCYCQLDNFAWGTRGIDTSVSNGQDCKDLVEKKPYEVRFALAQNRQKSCFVQLCSHSLYMHGRSS